MLKKKKMIQYIYILNFLYKKFTKKKCFINFFKIFFLKS